MAFVFYWTEAYYQILPIRTQLLVRHASDQNSANGALRNHSTISFCSGPTSAITIESNITGCVPEGSPLEGFFDEEASNQLFVMTSIAESTHASVLRERSSLMPSADVFAISFSHKFGHQRLQESSWLSGLIPDREPSSANNEASTTVVVDRNGEVAMVFKQGEDIVMLVRDLMALPSGLPKHMTMGHESLMDQVRSTGMDIVARVDCFGSDSELDRVILRRDSSVPFATSQHPVCTLKFEVADVAAVSKILLDPFGEPTLVTKRGIRIRCETGGGVFRAVNLYGLYLNLASAAVTLAIPRKLVLFFAVHCLGHLSQIYKHVLFEPFEITSAAAGVATRLVVNSAVFIELADIIVDTSQDGETVSYGISRERLGERVRDVVRYRGLELDAAAVDSLVNFCYAQVLSGPSSSLFQEVLSQIKSDWCDMETLAMECAEDLTTSVRGWLALKTGMHMLTSAHKDRKWRKEQLIKLHQRTRDMSNLPAMNIDDFSLACSSGEHLQFESWLKLFNVDRTRHPFELFFTPKRLQGAIDLARADRKQRDGSLHTASIVFVTQCPKQHKLIEARAGFGGKKACDQCGKKIGMRAQYWKCQPCRFHVCSACGGDLASPSLSSARSISTPESGIVGTSSVHSMTSLQHQKQWQKEQLHHVQDIRNLTQSIDTRTAENATKIRQADELLEAVLRGARKSEATLRRDFDGMKNSLEEAVSRMREDIFALSSQVKTAVAAAPTNSFTGASIRSPETPLSEDKLSPSSELELRIRALEVQLAGFAATYLGPTDPGHSRCSSPRQRLLAQALEPLPEASWSTSHPASAQQPLTDGLLGSVVTMAGI